MTNDLANKIASACLEAIQSRPDTPTEDELADVVRPLLADHEDEKYRIAREEAYRLAKERIERAEIYKPRSTGDAPKSPPYTGTGHMSDPTIWGVDLAEGPSESAVWYPHDPTIWGLPPHPSTQELYDARHVNSFKSGPCPADGCNGVVIRNSINNAGGCTCCGRGFAPNPTDEAW